MSSFETPHILRAIDNHTVKMNNEQWENMNIKEEVAEMKRDGDIHKLLQDVYAGEG